MRRYQVLFALEQASRLIGHTEFVVIGSLSILGLDEGDAVPSDMSMSIDIDCYTRSDPQRIYDISSALGEGSAFQKEHGYFLDPVSPALPSLPAGWEARLTLVEHAGLKVWFLDPDDAAVSKYARSEPHDLRWIHAGLRAGWVSLPKVRARLASTTFLDEQEESRVRTQVEADAAWLAEIRFAAKKGA